MRAGGIPRGRYALPYLGIALLPAGDAHRRRQDRAMLVSIDAVCPSSRRGGRGRGELLGTGCAAAPICVRRRIILGHTEIGFYDRYLWPTTRAATTLAFGDWIGRVYKRRRRHSALGMIRPVEYENRFIQTGQAAPPCVRQTGSRPGGQLEG
jgi:transposase InsO family protein